MTVGPYQLRPTRRRVIQALSALGASAIVPLGSVAQAQTYDIPLFSATSPWNTPHQGPTDPNSDAMIANFASTVTALKNSPDIQTAQWTVPLWYANASTPRVTVTPSTNWWPGVTAPIPASAKADPAGDHHLAVLDVDAGLLHEFWRAVKSGQKWKAGYGITFMAGGDGYQVGSWLASARAYGGSAVGGLIRYGEMQAGVIPHALALAYPLTRGEKYAQGSVSGGVRSIASHCDNNRSVTRMTDANIPEGARIRLKSSINVAARAGSNRAAAIIGTALQTYGAYIVDTGGYPVFFAENLIGKSISWTGLLKVTDARAWHPDDFEVCQIAQPLVAAP